MELNKVRALEEELHQQEKLLKCLCVVYEQLKDCRAREEILEKFENEQLHEHKERIADLRHKIKASRELLLEELGNLPEPLKTTARLFFVDCRKVKEIAEQTHYSTKAIYVHLRKIREKLNQAESV